MNLTTHSTTRHLGAALAVLTFALLALGSTGSNDSSAPPAPAAAEQAGCKTDMDCKGNRVCTNSQCVDPGPNLPPEEDPMPTPAAPPPRARPTPARTRAVRVSDPPGGCKLDGVIYQSNGSVWGCEGGGNWCASSGPLAGGCAAH